MGPAVYILGSLTTLICAVLLMRGYSRSGTRLLLWSAICFFGLALSNFLTFLDLVVLPNVDLYVWRLSTAAAAMLILVYGLIWEGE
ncbi:MAG: DUF5985 family protein [Candidatus Sulfotelmatobacter sp.]